MNIIITRKSVQYSQQFLKFESLKQAAGTIGHIEFLIYNDSTDTEQDKTLYIDKIKPRVSKFIYIRDPRKGDDAVKLLMPALGGIIFDDEYFLEDEEELINMLSYSKEITTLTTMNGVSVVMDFFQKYLDKQDDANLNNKAYLSIVKNAAKTMMEDYNKKNYELIQMSETATDLFTNTAQSLAGSTQQVDLLKKQVLAFEEKLKSKDKLPTVVSNTGPIFNFFPQVQYMKEKRIVRIKELGNVPFLTSFILGFRIYLEKVKNLRPKLIVVWQRGTFLEKAYSDFSWITQTNVNDKRNMYGKDIVFTNHPTSDVLSSILNDDEFDTYIVLDRSFYESSHILNSKGDLFYAVGSPRFIKAFNLPVKDCISSVISKGNWLLYVDYDESYPKERVNRERFYLQNYKEEYELML